MADTSGRRKGKAMIEAKGLYKRYGDKTAVDGLSFTIRPGMVTGFLGPNGAGKPVTELRHSLPPRAEAVTCSSPSHGRWYSGPPSALRASDNRTT